MIDFISGFAWFDPRHQYDNQPWLEAEGGRGQEPRRHFASVS